jgi:signal transduction histidine kinase
MDRGQMEQAFLNILQNAIEAQAGAVAVRLHARNGGRPTLHIEDSGQGFGPEAQANLFTPFFSTKPNGQGIGLTLVGRSSQRTDSTTRCTSSRAKPTTFTIVF